MKTQIVAVCIAALLSAALGAGATAITAASVTVASFPSVFVPVVIFGLVPLLGLMLIPQRSVAKAILAGALLEFAAIIGAAARVSSTNGPSFVNALAYLLLYGAVEFGLISILLIVLMRQLFVIPRQGTIQPVAPSEALRDPPRPRPRRNEYQ
jgi:hypothetical protein